MPKVIFIGLSLASVLLLVVLGLAITYGAMGVINMAHGEMVMLGAYTTMLTALYLHLNIMAGIGMTSLVAVLVAAGIGRVMFKKRFSGVFVSIIMLALVLLVRFLVIDAQPLTNWFNGLTDLGDLQLFGIDLDPYGIVTYYVVAIALAVTLIVARLLVESRAGHMQDSKLLLLDEPTAGMTAAETQRTVKIMIAQRITVMHLGQILAEGDLATIEQDERVRAAYLGSHGLH